MDTDGLNLTNTTCTTLLKPYRLLGADSARPARGGLALRPSHTPEFFSTGRSSSSQVASVSRDRTQVGALKFSVRVVLVLVGV